MAIFGNIPETNIAPENRNLERRFLLKTTVFRGYMLVLGKSSYFREPQVGEYYYILARIYVWLFRKYFIHNGQMPWSLRSSLTWWSEISQKRTAQVSKNKPKPRIRKGLWLPLQKKDFPGAIDSWRDLWHFKRGKPACWFVRFKVRYTA